MTISVHPDKLQKQLERTIRYKKVKQLKVHIYDEHVELLAFPIVFDHLDELEMNCYWSILEQIEFAHPNKLKKLKLYAGYKPSFDHSDLMKITNQWPELEEISLQLQQIDEAYFLMNNLKFLKKISIINIPAEHKQRFKTINVEWLRSSKVAECKNWEISESTTDNEIVIVKRSNDMQ